VASPFSPEQQSRFDAGFDKAVAKYPPERRRAALLPTLHLAQELLGWLPEAAMAYVGFRLEIPPVRVREVATFYTMYRLKPVGRHHIEICNSVCCWANGSENVLHHAEKRLGIRHGQVTADGKFSFGETACLAACGYGPAAVVNNFKIVEKLSAKAFDELVEKLSREPGQEMAKFPANQDTGRAHG
jgi:NADH-quinone oxidoreductase E subunit